MNSELPPEAIVGVRGGWWRRFDWNAQRGGQAGVLALFSAIQWLNWSSTYYLMTVVSRPIVAETGWPLAFVVAGLSLGLVVGGLVSPLIGRTIERHGGRPVLAAGSVILAIGLLGLGLSHDPAEYLAAWTLLGVGMAASLYDAAFATLGKLYGVHAQAMISNLMLIIAVSASLWWPFTALLVEAFGWRGACLGYAALHLAVGLPMNFFFLPKTATLPIALSSVAPRHQAEVSSETAGGSVSKRRILLVWLVGANITVQAAMGSALTIHLLSLLQSLGVAYATAVRFGSVIWLSQAGGRVLDALFGRRVHPVLEGVAASLLVLLGIALLLIAVPQAIVIGIVFFGVGYGVRGILKGTLPLVLFGAEGYATLIGKLGLPTLIAQAAGPALAAVALARYGAVLLLAVLAALAAVNLGIAYALRIALPRAGR